MTKTEDKARAEIMLAIEEEIARFFKYEDAVDMEKLMANIRKSIQDVLNKYEAVLVYCP